MESGVEGKFPSGNHRKTVAAGTLSKLLSAVRAQYLRKVLTTHHLNVAAACVGCLPASDPVKGRHCCVIKEINKCTDAAASSGCFGRSRSGRCQA